MVVKGGHMRTLKTYEPDDDFDLPKQLDRIRDTAVLIRQSDHRAAEDHSFSRESQLQLVAYAQRLRGDTTDEHVRVYDEGAGVSGQKRIDERVELNRLYNDIKQRLVGSIVIMHEDRLFRDEFHTNDTTFMQLLSEQDVLLFVRTDNRRYDCTKPCDRNALLEKMIVSRNYLDDHVLGRMNGNQKAKALQGLFDGRMLPMGYVTHGKKKQQTIMVYEPWAKVVRWLYERFQELGSLYPLAREIEAMPYLFPNPTAEDLMRYTFKTKMTKVPGGFKPASMDALRYMLANPAYIGAWVYDDAIVRENNHPAIVDRELFLACYHKITGRNLQGEPLPGVERRRLRTESVQAVLKYILKNPEGPIYVMHANHPEYVRAARPKDSPELITRLTFAIRANVIDQVFLARVKELAINDRHLGEHIKASIAELEEQHTESVISVEEHLAHVRNEIEKTMALFYDDILTLTPEDKIRYSGILEGLRTREAELVATQENSLYESLQDDMQELADVLADIPAHLDNCSMERQQRLARLLIESATIEELSIHWVRLTIVWRGPLANRPDVCLIWRQHGTRNNTWTPEEDAIVTEHYPKTDKWTILEALPNRSWKMVYERALTLGLHRSAFIQDPMPDNFTITDLRVFPDREVALSIVGEAIKQRTYSRWLHSAGVGELKAELAQNSNMSDSAIQMRSG
jgi:DNA invertase Pin-like site-specific DNA recombinase